MKVVEIKVPIWKTRAVGIAEYKLSERTLVRISYRDKNGNLLFPHVYSIRRDKALTYPMQTLRGGVRLRIIPIADLDISDAR